MSIPTRTLGFINFPHDATMKEVLEKIGQVDEVPMLQELQAFRAKIAVANVPRSENFLADLLQDLFYLVFRIAHEIATLTKTTLKDEELPQDANIIANFLSEILIECRRLLTVPSLFPSQDAQKAFLTRVASLCPVIANMRAIEKQNRSSLWHILNRDLTSIELVGSDYPDNDRTKLRSLVPDKRPAFDPDRRDAKNPWNNWLDNSAGAAAGWIAIQQKIPRLGDVMNRKKVYDYEALETKLQVEELVLQESEENLPQLPAVGHDFEHMVWSGFATIPKYSVGFRVGSRKSTDGDGRVTLEHLNKAIKGINLWETDMFLLQSAAILNPATLPAMLMARNGLNTNVPYFRYAMAYKP